MLRVLLFYVLIIGLASGQIIDVEGKRRSGITNGLLYEIDLSGKFGFAEVDTLSASAKSDLYVFHKKNTYLWLNHLEVSAADGVRNDFKASSHLRYNRWLHSHVFWEAFAQAQHQEINEIELRALGGTGPRFKLWDFPVTIAFLGTLYMFEYERILHGGDDVFHRLSSYLTFDFIFKYAKISLSGYYQPDLIAWKDYRAIASALLKVPINKIFEVRIGYEFFYDSKPVPGIEMSEHVIRPSLSFRFSAHFKAKNQKQKIDKNVENE